jgi:hypothetical protein
MIQIVCDRCEVKLESNEYYRVRYKGGKVRVAANGSIKNQDGRPIEIKMDFCIGCMAELQDFMTNGTGK